MPTLYNENYSDRSFILSQNRDSRPYVQSLAQQCECPFCIGNENMIEHIWLEKSTLDHDGIRIVNNKYPICMKEDCFYGVHDVIIDTFNHMKQPIDFPLEHWEVLLEVLGERYAKLNEDHRINMIQIFKNNGTDAGASIAHSHWQLVALEQIPNSLAKIYKRADFFYKREGYCELCHQTKNSDKEELIYETQCWVSIAPPYSDMSHETWIIPKEHVSHFGQLSQVQRNDLALVMLRLLMAQEQLLPGVHYNVCFMGSILEESEGYHFYIKIVPRKGHWAGFELATGCYINSISSVDHRRQMVAILNK